MKIALIGCGNAGSKVVDKSLEYQADTGRDFISHATAVNTATADFEALEYLPEDRRLLIGESVVKGHGAGTDNTVGREIAEADIHTIQRAVGDIAIHEVDAFIVATSFGGGTGSGAAPVVAGHLQESYDEPVYGLGILPARNEGGIYQLNAARSFPSLVRATDNVIVFDNEVWREGSGSESVSASYAHANAEIAKRFVTLFGAGEVDGSTAAENVIDSSEIINTLECGGISSIGYSTAAADADTGARGENGHPSLLRRFSANGNHASAERQETKVVGLLRQATTGQLTLPADVTSTSKALALVAGPQAELSLGGIEKGRNWLEDHCECLEVRGGDDPRDQPEVQGLVLLSGLTECARVDEFQKQAADAQDSIEAMDADVDERTEELITDDAIDPL